METTSFMDKCKGIALVLGVVLFGTAAILFSTTPAQADTPASTYATGKYGMQLASIVSAKGTTYWYILAWDTETGRSKLYYGSQAGGTKPAYSTFQLPSSPL